MDLLISFPDQSESFVLGCEYGTLLTKFQKGEDVVENNGFPIHVKNREVIEKTCITYGYIPFFGNETHDDWITFKALKSFINN